MKKIVLIPVTIIFVIFILNKKFLFINFPNDKFNFLTISKINKKNKINEFYSNKKNFSAVSVLENKKINIYKKNLLKNKKYEMIKNDDKYKKILSIDDFGNILYSSISSNPHYPDQGKVYLNNKKLNVNPGTHSSAINFEELFVWKFFHYHSKDNRFWLYIYDSNKDKIKYFIFEKKYPKKISFLDKENLYIETFDGKKIENHILNLLTFDLKASKKLKKNQSCKKNIYI